MTRVIVSGFSLSLDGFGAGPEQSRENPLGLRGMELHDWHFRTSEEGSGPDDIDRQFANRWRGRCRAFVMGRNMFGPIRGEWPDEAWKGWWGSNPPYHAPTFVLTHHRRESVVMEGGTTFHFVTEGIDAALNQAKASAEGKDVLICGGVSTVRQYLEAGHIDEVHFAITPVVLGRGEAMFDGIDLPSLGFRIGEHVSTEFATHVVLCK